MSTLSLIDGVIPWCSQSAQEDLRKVRADVAELIEAVADVYSDSCGTPCEAPCPSCRIYAALARVNPMTREQQAEQAGVRG